ncbi:probable pseudouridine-5'-phosphatase [Plutella xylostella]|uniref:probable pseudouridine-5'-phosphatase n=1 Tax=Plutella xylostella TaxID=51655 RepID=UPI0005D09E2B|nr:probable pseudouridine-5'-phosphatase [Plutella xylostella]XP_011552054.3 probable pseudouridine-5'-phosphatase [Plutella xylostella]XP_011552055.3 probable pseudouridine-5'-phosphatase [Plutella xylostella]XP_037964037.2 probable pseudouridine-5'-phosphatase [Plutella xylostella]
MRFYLMKNATKVFGSRLLSTKTFKKVTHCIFDMDGLLLDTELVYKKMITQLCAKYGHEYTDELMMKVLGGTEQRLSEILCKELSLPVSPEQFRDQLLKLGDTMLANTPLLDGAERLIRHLHKTKVPFALATSSSERSVKTKVAGNEELFGLFHHMVMGSTDKEVKFGKPHPDIFLIAAARFPDKPKPEQCLVFEDSPHGVTAAVAAKMQSVMVPDPHLDKRLTTHATIVLPSLAKFQPELFGLPSF